MNITNTQLNEATTLDFNDMRQMLNEMEINMIAVPPLKQMDHYRELQQLIYTKLEETNNGDNMILYPKYESQNYN